MSSMGRAVNCSCVHVVVGEPELRLCGAWFGCGGRTWLFGGGHHDTEFGGGVAPAAGEIPQSLRVYP